MTFHLDRARGVPVYRQIIDQIHGARAAARIKPGQQLPTVRQLALDLSVNPNTVLRAYRELELTGILATRQGSGTFVSNAKAVRNEGRREEKLHQFAEDVIARAGREGFTVKEVRSRLKKLCGSGAQP